MVYKVREVREVFIYIEDSVRKQKKKKKKKKKVLIKSKRKLLHKNECDSRQKGLIGIERRGKGKKS